MFKTISASIVALAVLSASVFYTPNPENLLGNSNLSTASSETIGTFRLRVNEFIGDANFNWTSSTQILEVIGLASTTQFRTPSATIASLKDASGNAYSTSTGGLSGTSTSTYLSVYTGASTLGGFANLNWTSSTNLFEVIGLASTTQFRSPSSTITGLVFGNATTSGNLTAVTGIFTTSVSTTLASTTNLSFTNATGTTLAITGNTTLATLLGAVDGGGATSLEIPNGAGGTTVNATGEVTVDSTARSLNFYDGTAEVVLNPEVCDAFALNNATAAFQGYSIRPFLATSTITKIFVTNRTTTESSTLNFYASSSINLATATSTSRKVFTADTLFSATSTALSCYQATATTTACAGGLLTGSTTIQAGTSLGIFGNSASTSYAAVNVCSRQDP